MAEQSGRKSLPQTASPVGIATHDEAVASPSAGIGKSKDATEELLETLKALHGRVGKADRVTGQAIATVVQQGADTARRNDPAFRHQLAFAVQDVEKTLRETLDIPPNLRGEMSARASSAPGLENDRALALMRSTSSIDDHRVVRDIRAMAFDIGRRDIQDSQSIRATLDTLENAARLAARVDAPPNPALRDPSVSTPRDRANATSDIPSPENGGPAAASRPGRQGGLVTASRSPFDAMMSGLRGTPGSPGASWDVPATPMAGRFALYEQRMQQGADDRALHTAERSGRAALKALEAFRAGEIAAVMTRIDAAAKTAPGGMADILADMRPGGRFADLRQQFNGALEADRGTAAAYDQAAASLARYGQDRAAVESVIARRPDAVNLAAKFDSLDAQIGNAASETPSRRAGKSMIDDLAQKAAELLQKAVDGIRALFGHANSAETASRPSPSPGA